MTNRFILPRITAFGATGLALPGAELHFFAATTTTPQDTYSNTGLTVKNTNPVVADSAGLFGDIFLSTVNYKASLTISGGDVNNPLWSADNIVVSTAAGPWNTADIVDHAITTVKLDTSVLKGMVAVTTLASGDAIAFADASNSDTNSVVTWANLKTQLVADLPYVIGSTAGTAYVTGSGSYTIQSPQFLVICGGAGGGGGAATTNGGGNGGDTTFGGTITASGGTGGGAGAVGNFKMRGVDGGASGGDVNIAGRGAPGGAGGASYVGGGATEFGGSGGHGGLAIKKYTGQTVGSTLAYAVGAAGTLGAAGVSAGLAGVVGFVYIVPL